MSQFALQTHCPHCGWEQRPSAVLKFSSGVVPCIHCGMMSGPMTQAEYSKARETRTP